MSRHLLLCLTFVSPRPPGRGFDFKPLPQGAVSQRLMLPAGIVPVEGCRQAGPAFHIFARII